MAVVPAVECCEVATDFQRPLTLPSDTALRCYPPPVRFGPSLSGRAQALPLRSVKSLTLLLPPSWMRRVSLSADDLLRDATYRRLWISIFISSFGGQVTMLALPLTAAVLLHATPTQMGVLTAMEVLPLSLMHI